MAFVRLPVEAWQTILRYAISVPAFFETDPFESCELSYIDSYLDEFDYWQSKRIRNALRRVCSAWDTYLQRFQHRYVTLTDVVHKRVRPEAVCNAIRINFAWDKVCECEGICAPLALRERMDALVFESFSTAIIEWNVVLLKALHPAFSTTGDWKAEIITSSRMNESIACIYMALPRIPRLRTTIGLAYPSKIPSGLHLLQTTSVLISDWAFAHQIEFPGKDFTISLPKLTTLSLDLSLIGRSEARFNQVRFRLPFLRHLALHGSSRRDSVLPFLLGFLRQCGSELLTFHHCFITRGGDPEIPRLFWTLCPKLRTLRTSMRWSEPPLWHPLETLRLHHQEIYNRTVAIPSATSLIIFTAVGSDYPSLMRFSILQILPAERPSTRHPIRIALASHWRFVIFWFGTTEGFTSHLVDICWERGYDLRDRSGSTFQEYLVFLLTISKRNFEKRRHQYRPLDLTFDGCLDSVVDNLDD